MAASCAGCILGPDNETQDLTMAQHKRAPVETQQYTPSLEKLKEVPQWKPTMTISHSRPQMTPVALNNSLVLTMAMLLTILH